MKRRGKDVFAPRKIYIGGELYWQVNFPKGHNGRRKRRTCRDHKEAETVAEQARVQFRNHGTAASSLSDRVRVEAVEAVELLVPFKIGLVDAAKFYVEHHRRINESATIETAVNEFLAAKRHDNLRRRYLTDLRIRLHRFSSTFGERKIASVNTNEIDQWIRGFAWSPLTRNTMRGRLSTLFAYAVGRGWCESNPVEKVGKIKANGGAIEILTPEQFARLLEVASEATLPYHLLGGFAGLRQAEIERLEWKDIHFDLAEYRAFTQAVASGDKEAIEKANQKWRKSALIEVPALKAKTANRRFVQIQDNLAAWLEPYIGRTGNACPPNLVSRLRLDRRTAGLPRWPTNALRHSFASYHLAHFQDAAKLALELGHTNQSLLFRHYRELVRPVDAAKYWNIRPLKQTNLIALSA